MFTSKFSSRNFFSILSSIVGFEGHSAKPTVTVVDDEPPAKTPVPVRPQPLEDMVTETAVSLLGPTALVQARKSPSLERGLPVYDSLTRMLPFPPHFEFWWKKLGGPFASMLETSRYSPIAQAKFLCFFYGTVIELMPPHDTSCSDSVMTIDGSPVELSWVLPSSEEVAGGGRAPGKAKPRQVRFAIEPMHPASGRRLKGSVVLDYLTSPRGSLGLVVAGKDSMTWRTKTEEFMFPNSEGDEIPDGSRFFVGFDFLPNGTIALKAYYLPAPPSPDPAQLALQGPMKLWDVDYAPLRRLVFDLEPALMEPLELLLSYFESLEDRHKPRIQIVSMDCVKSSENRLKIYCRPKEGSSWSDAVRSFTLGGRLKTPQMEETVKDMERLWNTLFPHANSSIDCDLRVADLLDDEVSGEASNGIRLDKKQHPVGGLLYYYSLFAGKESVYPKLYLPVTHYCPDDQFIARAIEEYYNNSKRRSNATSGVGSEDWVAKEVANTFNHRPLNESTGIHTYVTFALKKNGSELTNYFSPEPFVY
ncbi:hypothetical protein CC1G_10602 [Coprinopsis cinerea okayama7|uniref:Aromatic prenyltransferase n=1 Tax=Coprinopsis cinerea (strain Okayama-7 / 130 / ATCC MYA-4618 / FGSC 9003) TaxID=240176 RepID=A8P8P3_COPC7|nr:hypothetical protein CC1G_10602 [Coprinopsis cinerea okayama7\|eukprot:XP_001839609.1 hypothetical protein CC1G_10602 [Coprinopsis cinerea okayama7\